MTRMPRTTGKEVASALKRAGFVEIRASGSHVHLFKEGSGLVTVSVHAGEILKPKTLKSILEQAKLSVEELIQLL